MKKLLSVLLASSGLALLPTTVMAQATIAAQDGTFLGIANRNRQNPDSICNSYGSYGSTYGIGIFNQYGNYGGAYSAQGAYNPRAQNPPVLIVNAKIVGFVSKNPQISNRVDPDFLRYQCDQ